MARAVGSDSNVYQSLLRMVSVLSGDLIHTPLSSPMPIFRTEKGTMLEYYVEESRRINSEFSGTTAGGLYERVLLLEQRRARAQQFLGL